MLKHFISNSNKSRVFIISIMIAFMASTVGCDLIAGDDSSTDVDVYVNQFLPNKVSINLPQSLKPPEGTIGALKRKSYNAAIGSPICQRLPELDYGDFEGEPAGGGYDQLRSTICEMLLKAAEVELNLLVFDLAYEQIKKHVINNVAEVSGIGSEKISISVTKPVRNRMLILAKAMLPPEGYYNELGGDFDGGDEPPPFKPGKRNFNGSYISPEDIVPKVGAKLDVPPLKYWIESDAEGYEHHLIFVPVSLKSANFCPECADFDGNFESSLSNAFHWSDDKSKVKAIDLFSDSFSINDTDTFDSAGKYRFYFDAQAGEMRFDNNLKMDGSGSFDFSDEINSNLNLRECGPKNCVEFNGIGSFTFTNDFGGGEETSTFKDSNVGKADDDGGFIESHIEADFGFGFDNFSYIETFDGTGKPLGIWQNSGSGYLNTYGDYPDDQFGSYEVSSIEFSFEELNVQITNATFSGGDNIVITSGAVPDHLGSNIIGYGFYVNSSLDLIFWGQADQLSGAKVYIETWNDSTNQFDYSEVVGAIVSEI